MIRVTKSPPDEDDYEHYEWFYDLRDARRMAEKVYGDFRRQGIETEVVIYEGKNLSFVMWK